MPRIFDNIEQELLPALSENMSVSERADFCVGYFNLRGWRQVSKYVERWSGGEGHCCRLLIGMQRLPQEELREVLGFTSKKKKEPDNAEAVRLKTKLVEDFREQLMLGAPSNEDEAGLRKLAAQIRGGKVVIKLFLRHLLHAKLYLLFRSDPTNPATGYLGSSNLTFSGLRKQGELNVDVMDHDACEKLAKWFEDRWNDRLSLDISDELVQAIDESWAREELIPPHHIYIKIAYHLSQEARAGLSEFSIPRDFGNELLEYQTAAVKIAAQHLNRRNGVLIGDVVGLGKTLMAVALARIFEDDYSFETLIICPKNLVPMWENYKQRYRMRATVLSLSQVINKLPGMERHRIVIIDESHNLRNREGQRYRAIKEYIEKNESKCILLSATPYNKAYLDLSNQLRLFVPDNLNLGIRPERLLREMGEAEFVARHQASIHSLAAFEKSEFPDDWRDLMRLYLVRRTRSFIQKNYAEKDADNGRLYLPIGESERSYFPERIPRTVKFRVEGQYAHLFSKKVIEAINSLGLPRYELGNYRKEQPQHPPTEKEQIILNDLSRAGKRLMGFCRTNLLKRLESGGHTFLLSLERHVLRNFVFLHAIENGLPLPIGATDTSLLDSRFSDSDEGNEGDDDSDDDSDLEPPGLHGTDFQARATGIYGIYRSRYENRFRWIAAHHFESSLAEDLKKDTDILIRLIEESGEWKVDEDAKLEALHELLATHYPNQKVLVFSQFADTVYYLENALRERGVDKIAAVTGDSADPTRLAWRFSPRSNDKKREISKEEELRILITTDVLSEGQNLQDCSVVVNYDLPWTIIRLIQRAGRVDRIGQQADTIQCHSFLPADGIEELIRLRSRVLERLHQNAEVVGTDEAFFEDEPNRSILDLYNEKAGVLDEDEDMEVDLSSYAWQIWKNATDKDASLKQKIEALPSVVHSSMAYQGRQDRPAGVLLYMRTAREHNALAWIGRDGTSVTESQFEILKAAECSPDASALPRHETHHSLVGKGAELIANEEKQIGGQLGRPSGVRHRVYERLSSYIREIKGTLFNTDSLGRAIDDIYNHPLQENAVNTLNRQLRAGIEDKDLAELVVTLREEGDLCMVREEDDFQEPHIICSLGLISGAD